MSASATPGGLDQKWKKGEGCGALQIENALVTQTVGQRDRKSFHFDLLELTPTAVKGHTRRNGSSARQIRISYRLFLNTRRTPILPANSRANADGSGTAVMTAVKGV